MNAHSRLLIGGSSGTRPAPRPHAAIAPPFDPDDEYGKVHTTLPPELTIPDHFTDPTFLRADTFGGTLEGDYEPKGSAAIIANGGVTITTGRWKGLRIPYLIGANTTPPTMIMTPMLMMYPADVQFAVLTEQAEKAYDDLVSSTTPWNAEENGFAYSPESITAWAQYVQSTWGFRNVLWQSGRPPDGAGPTLKLMLGAGLVSFYIHGKEVNTQMSSEDLDVSLRAVDNYIGGRIPIGVHFSPDGNRRMGYPQCAPPYLTDWSPYDGRVHLMQQLAADGFEPNSLCPAGLQGSSMYYGRKRVNLGAAGGDGGEGPGAPNSRVIAFEIMAIEQLYGRCTEDYACLRSWELLCGTRNDPRVWPVWGFGNGNRYPDGKPI